LYFLPFVFQTQARIFNATTATARHKVQARVRGQEEARAGQQEKKRVNQFYPGLVFCFCPLKTPTPNDAHFCQWNRC